MITLANQVTSSILILGVLLDVFIAVSTFERDKKTSEADLLRALVAMASENQQPFSAAVRCSQLYKIREEIVCQFDIMNQDAVDYYLLKWQTPLEEGMMAPYLSVSKDGQPRALIYRGRVFKRGKPQAGDYVHVKAGETVSNKVDIATGYDLSEPGMYDIVLDTSVQYQTTAPGDSQDSEEKWQSLVSPCVKIELIAAKK